MSLYTLNGEDFPIANQTKDCICGKKMILEVVGGVELLINSTRWICHGCNTAESGPDLQLKSIEAISQERWVEANTEATSPPKDITPSKDDTK